MSLAIRCCLLACTQHWHSVDHTFQMTPTAYKTTSYALRYATVPFLKVCGVQKTLTTRSLAIGSYFTACAWLCAPVDHSCLMLPSSHSVMPCNGIHAAEWILRVCWGQHTHHHVFGNMQIHVCMCKAECSYHSCLMLPNLLSTTAHSRKYVTKWIWGWCGAKIPFWHICGNMQLHHCMRTAMRSWGSQQPNATKIARFKGMQRKICSRVGFWTCLGAKPQTPPYLWQYADTSLHVHGCVLLWIVAV